MYASLAVPDLDDVRAGAIVWGDRIHFTTLVQRTGRSLPPTAKRQGEVLQKALASTRRSGTPSITTTLPPFGSHLVSFWPENRFAEGKTTKLSSAWAGRHEEVLKGPFLRTVVVILEVWPESHWPGFALREADVFKTYMAWWCM